MRRQHEVENAVLKQMDPGTVLTRFQQIASAGKQMVRTDIPSAMLSQYVDLALKAKSLGIKELSLVPPSIDVIHPNFSAIHDMVKQSFVAQAKE
jgi:anionic cell wall polymer biosynthesis LytR-Cps2A-Psr (LCP) family protein